MTLYKNGKMCKASAGGEKMQQGKIKIERGRGSKTG